MGLIFRIFFGGWILQLIPWWLWFLIATMFASMSWNLFTEHRSEVAALDVALRSGTPEPIDVAAFLPRGPSAPLDEIHLSGHWRSDIGYGSLDKKYLDDRFAILASAQVPNQAIAIKVVGYKIDSLTRHFGSADDASTRVVSMRGFNRRSSDISEIRRAVIRAGGSDLNVIAVMEPYFGSRNAALKAKTEDGMFVVWIAFVFTAVAGLMGAFKFRGWRKRVASRHALRRPTPTQAAQAQSQPVRPSPPPPPQTTQIWTSNSAPRRDEKSDLESDAQRTALQQAKVDKIILEKFGKISRKQR